MTNFSELSALAASAWERGDLEQAFKLLQEGEEINDEGCVFDLAYFYDNGIHVEKNIKRALSLYVKAYKINGLCAASAAQNIAVIYKDIGNFRQVFLWYMRAHKLNDGDASLEVGRCYLNGIGVEPSISKAVKYLTMAMDSQHITEVGYKEASMLLKKVRVKNGDTESNSTILRSNRK